MIYFDLNYLNIFFTLVIIFFKQCKKNKDWTTFVLLKSLVLQMISNLYFYESILILKLVQNNKVNVKVELHIVDCSDPT